jgi:hypothetical protein
VGGVLYPVDSLLLLLQPDVLMDRAPIELSN